MWWWRRILRVPWTSRRSDKSILKKISPEYSLEGLMLKLKLQYFGHLIWRIDSLEKTLMLGKIKGRRRRVWQRVRWFNGITDSMDMSLNNLWEFVMEGADWRAAVSGVTKSQLKRSDWTDWLTLPYEKQVVGICYMMQGAQFSVLWQPRRVGWGGRWEEGSRGRRHIYIPMADSCWCMAETNTTL